MSSKFDALPILHSKSLKLSKRYWDFANRMMFDVNIHCVYAIMVFDQASE